MRLAFAIIFSTSLPAAEPPELLKGFPRSQIIIETKTACRLFDVYIARGTQQRAQGLMHVRALAADEGMIFLFPSVTVITMWMKNTYIPLDMIFLTPDGTVSSVHENAIPHSTEIISSGTAAAAVIELIGGTARRYGIKAGDRVIFPAG